jgi:hypothetical protein
MVPNFGTNVTYMIFLMKLHLLQLFKLQKIQWHTTARPDQMAQLPSMTITEFFSFLVVMMTAEEFSDSKS